MKETKSTNLKWQPSIVTRNQREDKNGHLGMILWLTGLSGAGKSSISHALDEYLFNIGCSSFVLDGDNVRHGLCSDLNFSVEDRAENIRRIGEVAKLFLEAGKIVIAAFISPINNDREWVRSIVPQGDFFEIYCECSVEECERRDVKGLYKLARVGKIKNFTGISSPYEPPLNPDLVINTGILSLEDSLKKIIDFLIEKKKIKNDESWD